MKFIVSSSTLQKQLAVLNGVIPSNPIIPILENFLFVIENGTLTATASDLQVSMTTVVQVDTDEAVKVAVPAKILLETLRSLPDQPVSISIDEETFGIEITSYKGRYKLSGESASDYPQVPTMPLENYTLNASCGVLHKAIANTLFAIGTDDLRPAMTGMYFKLNSQLATFVSTDGHKLVKYEHDALSTDEEKSVIIPKKALALLKSALPNDDTDLAIALNASNAFFKFGEVTLVCRLIDERYPDYENAIPTHNHRILVIDKNEFLSSLKRLSIYANKITNQIRLRIEADNLTIFAEDLDYANEAQENLLCEFFIKEELIDNSKAEDEDYDAEDEDDNDNESKNEEEKTYFEIGFNAKFLIDMLSILNVQRIEMSFSTPSRASIIVPEGGLNEGESILMLIMPVLLNRHAYM